MNIMIGRSHWDLIDVDVRSTEKGIEVGYHGLVVGVIEIVSQGHYQVNGMDYDRLHMAIRDVIRKFWKECER